jgi:hypothetical protein
MYMPYDQEMSKNTVPNVQPTSSTMALAHKWDHIKARLGINRFGHRVSPGLYTMGTPAKDSPVFVTANYTLSFDALRSALGTISGYILVLDTHGVNVWCAAGKGTFGTDELVHHISETNLQDVVSHNTVILPQLGAAGVSAHEVKKRSGFTVEYGPVRAADLPEYLNTRKATPDMRKVHFTLWDRVVLIPVEVKFVLFPILIIIPLLYILGGFLVSFSVLTAILAGNVLFPILLPWIPTHDFSSKGFILGGVTAFPFALSEIFQTTGIFWQIIRILPYFLVLPSITAFLCLNFTGSTTFTSRTGVKREIFKYIPIMGIMVLTGSILTVVITLFNWVIP